MTIVIVTHEMGLPGRSATGFCSLDEGIIQERDGRIFNHPKNPRTIEFLSKML